jgi:glycosyltransferase involved in cell wall biosynthesis
MSSGCCILATDIEPINEILPFSREIRVDHRNYDSLRRGILNGIKLTDRSRAEISKTNRRAAIKKYEVASCMAQWHDLLGN